MAGRMCWPLIQLHHRVPVVCRATPPQSSAEATFGRTPPSKRTLIKRERVRGSQD